MTSITRFGFHIVKRIQLDEGSAAVTARQLHPDVTAALESLEADARAAQVQKKQTPASADQCDFARSMWPSMVSQGTIASVEQHGAKVVVTVHMDKFVEAWEKMGPKGASLISTIIARYQLCERPSASTVQIIGDDGSLVSTKAR